MGRFQMQAFTSADKAWRAMEDGAAGHIWKPRATIFDAAAKCLAWSSVGGRVCIPQMQVVDLETGDVVWRSNYFGASVGGEPILLAEDAERTIANAAADRRRQPDAPVRSAGPQPDSLF